MTTVDAWLILRSAVQFPGFALDAIVFNSLQKACAYIQPMRSPRKILNRFAPVVPS